MLGADERECFIFHLQLDSNPNCGSFIEFVNFDSFPNGWAQNSSTVPSYRKLRAVYYHSSAEVSTTVRSQFAAASSKTITNIHQKASEDGLFNVSQVGNPRDARTEGKR